MANISKKVVVVGDAGCGKTSLLIVYSTDKVLDRNTSHTLGYKVMDVVVDGQKIALSLCSTSG